ncbi:TolB family protein [Herpetosiphon llansteffanensis]
MKPSTTILPATPQPLTIPAVKSGKYNNLVWLDQGLLAQKQTLIPPLLQELWWINEQGEASSQLALPLDPASTYTEYVFPQRLPNKLLGVRQQITTIQNAQFLSDGYQYVQFDPTTEQLTTLLPASLPRDVMMHSAVVWSPTLDRALITDRQYLGSQYYWWTAATGLQPLDLGVAVAQYFAWSPDGTTIAFFGKPSIGSGSVPGALTKPANLYLMDADGGNRRMILAYAYSIAGLQWSPNGRWLVIVARFNGSRDIVWLVDSESGDRLQLTPEGSYQWPVWSPDGSELAVIWYDPADTGVDGNDYVIRLAVPPIAR